MDLKTKIALQMLATKAERGILNEEQIREEFKKITGSYPDEIDSTEEGEQLGELIAALWDTEPGHALLNYKDPEPDSDPENPSTVDLALNPPTDKMIEKRLSGRAAKAKN